MHGGRHVTIVTEHHPLRWRHSTRPDQTSLTILIASVCPSTGQCDRTSERSDPDRMVGIVQPRRLVSSTAAVGTKVLVRDVRLGRPPGGRKYRKSAPLTRPAKKNPPDGHHGPLGDGDHPTTPEG